MTNEERIFQNDFTIEEDRVVIGRERTMLMAPTVTVLGKTVLVDFAVNEMNSAVKVTFYDDNGREVFANSITTDAKRITSYDVSNLPAGSYDMYFEINGKSFVRKIRTR